MSRQHPPLPPGPPPSRHRNGQSDQYRDSENYHPGDRYQQPPPPPNMYHFSGALEDSYRSYRPTYVRRSRSRSPPRHSYNSSRDDRSYRPERNEPQAPYRTPHDDGFNFRYDAPPGVDYGAADQYRNARRSPPRGNVHAANGSSSNNRNGPRGNYDRGRGHGRVNGRAPYRGRVRGLASDRAFLKTNREPTPELMSCMDEDAGNGVKFRRLEELSDSDEAEMECSEDDDDDQQPKKQARTNTGAADGDSVPRWSNPDPYTALPPPDESLQKKKDVVRLIRKARVATTSENHTKPKAATDDFISFDFGDEEDEAEEDDVSQSESQRGIGIEGAPTGPRSSNNTNKGKAVDIGDALRNVTNGSSREKERSGTSAHTDTAAPSSSKPHNAKSTPLSLESDSALGNRKRNIRDEIKGPPRIHTQVPTKGMPSGAIERSWLAVSDDTATPWISIDHSDSANMGIWLHKEIMDFYHWVKPKDFEQKIRYQLVEDLRAKVKTHFSLDADVLSFGSFPAGLYLPTADMDLVCVSRQYMHGQHPVFVGKRVLFDFANFLRRNSLALDNKVECISGAKVPLVKYVDRLTGLKVDISFENDTGLIANKTFQDWKEIYPCLPILVSLIKHVLAMRGLNEPVNGGIGGFSVICLVVSLLQHMPQVQSGSMKPEHNLGEILMEFFDLWGNHFNVEALAIVLKPAEWVPKRSTDATYKASNLNKFSIIDPNRSDNDIAGGSKNTSTIVKLFSDCFNELQNRMSDLKHSGNRKCESILSPIIAGNYSSFRLQREHLAHVHEKLYGSVNSTEA